MKIAVGNSRMDKKWKNKDITWEDFIARVGSTIRTTETVSEFRKMSRAQQDSIKDVGGFVGGALRERKAQKWLCPLPLPSYIGYGLCQTRDLEQIESLHDFQCCIYSTHKHTPEAPRLRLIITTKKSDRR